MTSPEGETNTEQRLDRLEARQASQDSKLDQIIAKLTGGNVTRDQAQADTEARLDRPTDIGAQVRAELERAEQERAKDDDLKTMKQQIAQLTERPPAPPQPRRERAMWGSR